MATLKNITSFSSCMNFCCKNSTCTHAVFNSNSKTCWLKSGVSYSFTPKVNTYYCGSIITSSR